MADDLDKGTCQNGFSKDNEDKHPSPHIAIDLEPGAPAEAPADAPPPFEPYEAEFFESSDGDIISHDHHLNEDGEALYRFLLAQSAKPPSYLLTINGTHQEHRTTTRVTYVNGQQRTQVVNTTVTITDFNFSIDLAAYIVHGPTHFSWPDDTPAYRGLLVRQVMTPEGTRRKTTKEEKEAFKADEYNHDDAGIPPWQDLSGATRSRASASSMSLRQWADEYAASRKRLKELVYEKKVYGWHISNLRTAIENAIAQTGYTGSSHVRFEISSTRICIRPDNGLSRTLSKTLYKVLLWIFLIYPFIWLFKRFSRYGGGRWEVYGGMYATRYLEPLREDEDISGLIIGEEAKKPTLAPRLIETEGGEVKKLIGYREGEFFKEWEDVIKRCAVNKVRRDEPFTHVGQGLATDPVLALDGY